MVGGNRSGDWVGDDGEVHDGIFRGGSGGGSVVDRGAAVLEQQVAVDWGGVGGFARVAECDLADAEELGIARVFEVFA